jgi:hypothetical protein
MNWSYLIRILFVVPLTYQSPSGSPKCIINERSFTAGMGLQTVSLGFGMTAKPINGSTAWSIQITGTRPDYQGLLMYVTSKQNPNAHLGSFQFDNHKKWRYLPQNVCFNITQGPNGTITHKDGSRVLIGHHTFTWIPSNRTELDRTNLVVSAVIASSDPNVVKGTPKWQILKELGLSKTNTTSVIGSPPSIFTSKTSSVTSTGTTGYTTTRTNPLPTATLSSRAFAIQGDIFFYFLYLFLI